MIRTEKNPNTSIPDISVSMTTVISWICGIVLTVAGMASLYGEQKQRLDYTEIRQTKLELAIQRIEALSIEQREILIRLTAQIDEKSRRGNR